MKILENRFIAETQPYFKIVYVEDGEKKTFTTRILRVYEYKLRKLKKLA